MQDIEFESIYSSVKPTKEDVASFEERLKYKLPQDYFIYLIEHNGEKPKKKIFYIPNQGQSTLHHLYGINNDDDFLSLNQNFDPAFNDINTLKKGYLQFGDDTFGNPLCLCLKAGKNHGKIYFYDHEESNFKKALIELSPSLSSFFADLLSDEEYDEELRTNAPELWAEFQERLNQIHD